MEGHPAATRGTPYCISSGAFVAPEFACRQCVDSKGTTVALWETSRLEDPFHARLTIKHSALAIVTELVTTLTLNRIAMIMNW